MQTMITIDDMAVMLGASVHVDVFGFLLGLHGVKLCRQWICRSGKLQGQVRPGSALSSHAMVVKIAGCYDVLHPSIPTMGD